MYSEQLLDHFEHPRNAGLLDAPDALVVRENPVCGDVLQFAVKISDGRVTEARFQAKGCVASIACGSALAEMVEGSDVTELRAITAAVIEGKVGGLPPASGHAAHLAADALSGVLEALTRSGQ